MEILKVENSDLKLTVGCNSFHSTFQKAQTRHSDIFSATSYSATEGKVLLLNPDTLQFLDATNEPKHPIFFENKDYFFEFDFKASQGIRQASIYSKLREVQNKFYFRAERNFLAGTINFGNDLGKSDLIVRYETEAAVKEFCLSFEVFPTKLNYRHDFDRIVADIEREFPYLVLDFLKKTYRSFKTGSSVNTDLIWWQVFGGLYKELLHSSKYVLQKPHSRIVKKSRYIAADHLIDWTSRLEEEFSEYKHLPNYRYFSEYKSLSNNTPENRFFKHAITHTTRRYKKVRKYIEAKFSNQISDQFRLEMENIERQLDVVSNHPFFRTISEFKSIKQESLVLQKATGYSNIYRCWVMLKSGLKFLDGVQQIELKNIADLYQIWCFLEIKGVLQRILGKDRPDEVKVSEIHVDDFVFRIEKGATSQVTFEQDNGDIVELFHDYSFSHNKNQEVRSYTITQRPDIVLRITKNDLRDNYVLTYLFDAKYRLQSDENPLAPDFPPEDAINQMHRYRDAIYYSNKERNRPEKEVIGAYILFPGSGELEQIQKSDYFRSIENVNIGAFPLRPNDLQNRVLLEDHLKTILGIDTETTLNTISPQKFSVYEPFNPEVLIGYVPDAEYEKCFTDTDAPFYFTGVRKPSRFGYGKLRYFAPYIAGIGIKEYFEIVGYEMVARNAIFEPDHSLHSPEDSSERLILKLGKRLTLSKDHIYHKLKGGPPRPYKYSKLNLLRNPVDGKIETI